MSDPHDGYDEIVATLACPCFGWAREYVSELLTDHHRNCRHYAETTERNAAWLLGRLVAGIDRWASEGDGIPDFVLPAYQCARFVTRVKP